MNSRFIIYYIYLVTNTKKKHSVDIFIFIAVYLTEIYYFANILTNSVIFLIIFFFGERNFDNGFFLLWIRDMEEKFFFEWNEFASYDFILKIRMKHSICLFNLNPYNILIFDFVRVTRFDKNFNRFIV